MAILMAGGCHVLIPKFDAKSAFDAIQEQGVTSFITVPAIMADLLSYARYEIALQFSEILGVHTCWANICPVFNQKRYDIRLWYDSDQDSERGRWAVP
jgi:hypothetical protein